LVFTQWWEDELEPGALKALIDEFEAQNPRIQIRLDTRSYGETRSFLVNRSGAEEPLPDIIALDYQWLYELVRQKTLEPLAAYRETGDFSLQNQQDLPEGHYEQWAVPLVSFMYPLFYNIGILKEAGFDRPPKTRTEFLDYALAITGKAAGRYGTALSLGEDNHRDIYREILPWFWAAGTCLIQDGRTNFTGPPVIETLGFIDRFHREGILSPGSFSKTEAQKREEFLAGKIGMMIGSLRDIDLFRERLGEDNFGITAIPGPDGYIGKPVFGLSSWYAGISRRSSHKDEAWRFLAFLTERISSPAVKVHAMPERGKGGDGSTGVDPHYAKAYEIYQAGDVIREFSGDLRAPGLDSIVREELYAMLEQGRSPGESAAAMQKKWEALTKKKPVMKKRG
ncbi:MAG: extracellular solute-binding protein, partial [Treponema sp.]|nr:extracellular solute-binding protein [Treponema sp.]